MPAILSRSILAIGIFVFVGLAIKYAITTRQLAEAQQAIVSWQVKYSTAVSAQQESEHAISELQEKYRATLASLEEWRKKYLLIDRKNTVAQRRIRDLEARDESIRGILSSRVPDDVWRVLFPDSKTAGDISGDEGSGTGTPTNAPQHLR